MADSTKRIMFEVDEGNMQSAFERMKRLANESGRSLIESANKYSQSGKDVLRYLQEEISLIERRNKLEFEARKDTIRGYKETGLARATTSGQKEAVQKAFSGRMAEFKQDVREQETHTKLLREIVESIKSTSRQEIAEDKKLVEQRIASYKAGRAGALDPEEEAKIKLQAETLGAGAGKSPGGIMGQVFMGTLLAGAAQNAIRMVSGVVNARDPERAISSIIGAVPFVGELGSSMRERHIDARENEERARMRMAAMGGGLYGGRFGTSDSLMAAAGLIAPPLLKAGIRGIIGARAYRDRGGTRFMGTELGFTEAEMYGEASNLARVRGMGSGIVGATNEMMGLRQGFGLDASSLYAQERFGGTVGRNILNMRRNLGGLGINFKARAPEFTGLSAAMGEQQILSTGRINEGQQMTNIMALARLDPTGKFTRNASYFNRMNQSLMKPSNQYQSSRQLSVLASLNPGASYTELLEMQEQGMGQKGYMSGMLKSLTGRYGGGDTGIMAIKNAFGLDKVSDARRIMEEFQKDPKMWSQVYDKGDMTREQAIALITGEGAALTPGLAKEEAKQQDEWVKGVTEGVVGVFTGVGEKIKENMTNTFGEVKTELGTIFGDLKEKVKSIGNDDNGLQK